MVDKRIGKTIKITKEMNQILLGSILGDASIIKNSRHSAIFSETHSINQEGYLKWKNSYLNFKENVYTFYDKRSNRKYNQIRIRSPSSPSLLNYYNLFYGDGNKKLISQEVLNRLELLGLAVWYCDDGCFVYGRKNIVLSTQSFKDDLNLIQTWLKSKFEIDCKIKNNNGGYLYFSVEDSIKFVDLMKDVVPVCMLYKLGMDKQRRIKALETEQRYKERKKELSKKYWLNNKKRLTKKAQLNYIKNKEERIEWQKRYYQKNRQTILEKKVIYRKGLGLAKR